MWTPTLLFVTVCLVASGNAWKPGTNYTYHIRGRTLAGIHQVKNQYAGVLIRGKLWIKSDNEDQLTLKVQDMEYADIHRLLSSGWATNIPDEELEYKSIHPQTSPVQLQLKDGMIDKMVVEKSLPSWEVNILKAIASQFQVNIKAVNLQNSKMNIVPHGEEQNGVYKTKEDSINGICETLYEVSPMPNHEVQIWPELGLLSHLQGNQQIFSIEKSRNFSNCDKRMVYHYGVNGHEGWVAGSNHMGNMLYRTSGSRIIVTGDLVNHTIQYSETIEKAVATPDMSSSQKGIVVSHMSVTLESATPSQELSPPVKDPRTMENLVYEYQQGETQSGDLTEDSTSSFSSSSSSSSSSYENNLSSSQEIQQKPSWKGTSRSSEWRNQVEMIRKPMRSSRQLKESHDSSSSASSSSSEASSFSSSDEYLQSQPKLDESPYVEFLPDNMINHVTESSQIVDKIVSEARKIGQSVVSPNKIIEENLLIHFSILSRLISVADSQQLQQALGKLFYPPSSIVGSRSEEDYHKMQNQQSWMAFRDALSTAGTGPALVTIKTMIQTSKVKDEEAAALVAVLPTTARYPTTEYMNYFFELVRSEEVEKQRFLNTSAIIAFTNLVRKSIVDRITSQHRYSIRLSEKSEHHHAVVREKYIPYLQMKLKDAITQEDSIKSQVYIRALGNIAHRQILEVFEPYLEGKIPTSHFQRLLMVASLDEMTKVYPSVVRSLLYKIYRNHGETSEIRVAAVMQLMKTNPPAQLLQRMAEQTNYGNSKHVNAAVKSAIESAAKGEYNANPEMVRNAQAAVNFMSSENYGAHYCRSYIHSFLSKRHSVQDQHQLTYIHGLDGEYPSSIIYNQQRKSAGYIREPETVSFMSSSSEELFNLLSKLQPRGNEQQYSGDTPQDSDYSYQKIFDILKGEYEPQKKVEGNILVSILGGKRYFTFDNQTIRQLPQTILQIMENMQKGVNLHLGKYYIQDSVEMAFPMAMGLRFSYSHSSPAFRYLGVRGSGEIKPLEPSVSSSLPVNVGFNGIYHYLHTTQRRSKIAFVFGKQRYVAGFEKIAQISLPLQGKWQLNGSEISLEMKVRPLTEINDLHKLFQYQTRVYTTYQNITDVKPYIEGEQVKQVQSKATKKYQGTYGKEGTGYAFQVNVESEKSLLDMYSAVKDLTYIPSDILDLMTHLDDSVTNNNYTLSFNPQESSPEHTVISLSYKTEEQGTGQGLKAGHHQGLMKHHPRRKNLNQGSGNRAHPSVAGGRTQEILSNVNSGIQGGKAHVFDASISFGGNQNKGHYSLTVAHAGSPVSDRSRYLLYYKGVPVQETQNVKGSQAAVEINIKKPFISLSNYRDAMGVDPTSYVEGKINFDESGDSVITFQGKMERSQQRKEYVQTHPLTTLCVQQMQRGDYLQYPCRNATLSAGYLDKYELSMKYQNVPLVYRRAAHALYSLGRHLAYGYNKEDVVDVNNAPGQLNVGVQWSQDLKNVNVSLQTPNLLSLFENVGINEWLGSFLVHHPRHSHLNLVPQHLFNRQPPGVCSLDTVNTTTFNNKTYPVNLGDCYHVLAMYSPQGSPESTMETPEYSEQYDYNSKYFAVLAKENNMRKVVKIVLGDDVITLEPSGSNGVTVNSNGKIIEISENSITRWQIGPHELNAYVEPGTNNVVVHYVNQGIEVIYDGYRTQITIPSSYRNKVRGLCGTYDGEPINDFTGPRNCVLKNPQIFTASYAVTDGTCQGPAVDIHSQSMNAPCYPKKVLFGNVVSDGEVGRRGSQGSLGSSHKNKTGVKSQQGCTSHKVRIVEAEGKTCFSIKPQVTCNANCKPQGTIEKTIQFHCLNESSATRHWVTMVKKGANPDFSQKKSNYQMNSRLPEKCVPN